MSALDERAAPAPPRASARFPESGLLTAAGFLLPLIAAAGLNRGAALFRSDLAVLAALDDGASLAGSFSRSLAQLAANVPLGNLAFRLALPSVLGLAVFSWALSELSRALFSKQRGHSRLDPWLATGAGLVGSMHLVALSEGTVAGGAVWGPACTAWLLARSLKRGVGKTRSAAAVEGTLLGLALAESPWCAAVAIVGLLVLWPDLHAKDWFDRQHLRHAAQRLRSRPGAWLGAWTWQHISLGAVLTSVTLGTALALWAPVLLTTTAEHLSQVTPEGSRHAGWGLLEWAGRSGLLWCAGALLAGALALQDRRPLLPLAGAVLLDWTVPHGALGGWTGELTHESSRVGLHLLAVGGVACLGALGLRTAVETARGLELFGARQLSVLVSIVAVAGSLARAEDSIAELTETRTRAAEVWTDEALGALPQGALVLTHSPEVGRRLLSAQATGERADVLILPVTELTDARRVARWLEREPALDLLLRDLSLSETPSERAVARLVDARPVYVEPDESWDRRLLEHLWPGVPLARMSAHALGRSDRLRSLEERKESAVRISRWSRAGLVPERATAGVLEGLLDALCATLDQVDHGSLELLREQRAAIMPDNQTTDPEAQPHESVARAD